jgi:predicted AAA+ superfamily ATPase
MTGTEKFLFSRAFAKCEKIYIRERGKGDILGHDISFCPDIVYYFYDPKAADGTDRQTDVFCITNYRQIFLRKAYVTDETQYMNEWINLIKEAHSSGRQVKLMATTYADYLLSQELATGLDEENIPYSLVPYPLTWQEFLAHLKDARSVMAGRMHALILGHIAGCQLHPFLVSKKIEKYAHDYLCRTPQDIKKEIEETLGGLFPPLKQDEA